MWGDVQKVLNRYVDDGELFQRLDARLRTSKELLLLKMEGVRDHEGRIEERAIYTTHSMLKAEKELVGTAEGLAACHTHAVSSDSLEKGLSRIQGKLKEKDTRLSEGQEQAIRHLVEPGQLKCIVGYAGAGKQQHWRFVEKSGKQKDIGFMVWLLQGERLRTLKGVEFPLKPFISF